MKKTMSDMSAQDLVEATAALGCNYKALAERIGRSHTSVSHYVNGKKPIPLDIAKAVGFLLEARAKEINLLARRTIVSAADIGAMIVHTNEIRQASERQRGALARRALCMAHRLDPPDTRVWEPYRLGYRKVLTLARALVAWKQECESRLRTRLDDARRIRMHVLELADLKAIMASLPRTLPYEILFTHTEWEVIARSLRWFYSLNIKSHEHASAYALYQHMRRHKHVGYPVTMMRARTNERLSAQESKTP